MTNADALTVAPEALTETARHVATISDNLSAAHLAAAAPTSGIVPAAADEVSTAIARLFSRHAVNYQAVAGQAAAFNDQFVQHLNAGAFSYTSVESLLTSLLQDVPPALQPIVGFPFAVAGIGLVVGLLLFIALLDLAYGVSPTLTTQFTEWLAQFLGVLGVL